MEQHTLKKCKQLFEYQHLLLFRDRMRITDKIQDFELNHCFRTNVVRTKVAETADENSNALRR